MGASDGLCRPESIHAYDRGSSYLFKEDAKEQWTDRMALVSIDMYRELLHVIAVHTSAQQSQCCSYTRSRVSLT